MMSNFQQRIIKYTKKQEKNQYLQLTTSRHKAINKPDSDAAQTLELSDGAFKVTMISK